MTIRVVLLDDGDAVVRDLVRRFLPGFDRITLSGIFSPRTSPGSVVDLSWC